MKDNIFHVFFSSIILITSFVVVMADTVATPCSYSVEVEGGVYIFVMLAPPAEYECMSQGDVRMAEAKELRRKYPSGGMYEKGKSSQPLWTVDWFSREVIPSFNGEYLVRMGPWAQKGSDEAFSFFDKGKLLKTYTIADVIENIDAMPRSVSHFRWEDHKWVSLNSFNLITLEKTLLTFDMNTGEMTARYSIIPTTSVSPTEPSTNAPNYQSTILLVGLTSVITALLVGAGMLFVRRKW